jgi:membrane peptidoglycan carboxypeptidase
MLIIGGRESGSSYEQLSIMLGNSGLTHRVKLLGRIVVTAGVVILVAVGAVCGWLYFYTADLPSMAELDRYSPSAASEIQIGAGPVAHVVPGNLLGKYIVNALVAAEGHPESRGPIRATIANLLSGVQPGARMYSWQIASGLVANGHGVRRQILELRLAEQIQRHFDERQVLTVYLNRVYFGENAYGAEDASMRYFGKHAADLSLDEAALLGGLIRSPGRDSPVEHPESAVQRRNWVLDQMISQGSVSREEGKGAKTAPLIVKQTAKSEATYDFNRCAMKRSSHGSPTNATIRVRPGEKSTKQTPVIAFEVLESGEIAEAVVYRSSGIADIDNYALASIRAMRYKERPPGCGVIDSKATVNVDF